MTSSGGTSWTAWSFGLSAVLTGIALLVGFLTPVAGVFASLGYFIDGLSLLLSADLDKHSGERLLLNLFVTSLALVLLGPGAFSVDARLFGRREIIIPDGGRSRHQRSEDSQ